MFKRKIEIDVEDMAKIIAKETGISYEVVMQIICAEESYLKEKGVMD